MVFFKVALGVNGKKTLEKILDILKPVSSNTSRVAAVDSFSPSFIFPFGNPQLVLSYPFTSNIL